MSTPTPTPLARVRHAPTPRDPSIPATMRVAVEVGFVQSCPDCRDIVAKLAQSCIGDPTVTAFRALPGRKHAHEVTEGSTALPGLAAAPPAGSTAVPQWIAEGQAMRDPATGLPASDTNGSGPDADELFPTSVTHYDSEMGGVHA